MNSFEKFEPSRYETQHTIHLNGTQIIVKAIAEDFILYDDLGNPEASMFSTSYIREDCESAGRPVIFVWDGGPGCSTGAENASMFGLWRIKNAPGTNAVPKSPPYELEENPNSILDICDVVLVDPVSVGYARLLAPEKSGKYFGVDGDAIATSIFIEQWLTEHKRWNSPKYMCGTSYGTIRCTRVLDKLNGGAFHDASSGARSTISFNGVILVGSAISVGNCQPGDAVTEFLMKGVEPTVLFMRSMAATNCYHNRKEENLSAFCDEAERWAQEKLAPALKKENLDESQLSVLAEQMSMYTGVDAKKLKEMRLKVPEYMYTGLVMEQEGLDVGMYDSRRVLRKNPFMGIPDPTGDDPGMSWYSPAIEAVNNGELRERLGISFNRRHVDMNFQTNALWDWSWPRYSNADLPPRSHIECLAAAMRTNEKMHLLIANGLYDLSTWIGTNSYIAENMGFPPQRTEVKAYRAGHLVFFDSAAAVELCKDIRKMIMEKQEGTL